ncbi:MAG: hypothetical protein HDQ98_13820 [Lachnospiraceae bacterium]|nr:hypothetical protein [Lachnospiraceae bacterium]
MKKRRFQKITALAAVAVSVAACPLSASAAEVKDVFDASYYADSYADLKEAFGYDEAALLQHYMTYGLNEGRTASTVFDVAAYRAAYADLEAAFGDDWNAYVNHYYTYGITEGRTAGVPGESIPGISDSTSDNTSAEGTPVEGAAGQQAPVQTSGSEIWVQSSGYDGVYDKYDGVYDNNGTPVNVTIAYSDVRDYDGWYDPNPGCEWQSFNVSVTVHDADVDSFYQALKNAIGFDQSSVQNLVLTYANEHEAGWTCDIIHNGSVYESVIMLEWYKFMGSGTGVGADFIIVVPQGYRLTTTVQMDANTVVKHK